MKHISRLFKIISFVFIIIVTASCGKSRHHDNYYKVDGEFYDIKSGIIINNGEKGGGFHVDLRLYCENKKDFINFGIISSQAESIPSSTYEEFDGFWAFGYNSSSSYSDYGKITSGKIVIDRSKDGYLIEFKGEDEFSNKVKVYYKGELDKKDESHIVHKVPDYVIPSSIYGNVSNHFPIHIGTTPPEINGEYVSAPHKLVFESYDDSDDIQYYSDRYMAFSYNGKQMNFYGKQYDSIAEKEIEEICYGVKITGTDNLFTCYYVVDGYPDGYYAQQSFLFSGKKTDQGIEDFHTAIILLETSGHPNMPQNNSFRVLKDEDGLAEYDNWLSGDGADRNKSGKNEDLFKMWIK